MIALDLDNTIICYNGAFRAAAEILDCLPEGPVHKGSIKSAAVNKGGNDLWTELQGIAYGAAISHATFFPGFQRFTEVADLTKNPLVVISHKTEFPAIGDRTSLRDAALTWLKANGFNSNIPVIFCDSREEKIEVLRSYRCRTMIDDLPEIYQSLRYPESTAFLLFDPFDHYPTWSESKRIKSWDEGIAVLFSEGK